MSASTNISVGTHFHWECKLCDVSRSEFISDVDDPYNHTEDCQVI